MSLDKELEQTVVRNEQRIRSLEQDVTEIKGDIKAIKDDIYVLRNNDLPEMRRGIRFWLEVLGAGAILTVTIEYILKYFLKV